MSATRVIIIGAGIVGVSAAYELARGGARVTLLDKGPVAGAASFGNAGIIAVGHPPLPRPGLIWKSIKWMLDPGSPLYIKPRLDPALIKWLWQFARACNGAHFDRCMHVLTHLGIASKECFDRIVSDENISCDYHSDGWYEVFATDEGLAHGRHDASLIRAASDGQLTATELTGNQLRQREPAFNERALGAVHYPDSAFANPQQFTVELADRAARLGAEIQHGPEFEVAKIIERGRQVEGVLTIAGRRIDADVVVLAAGSWTTRIAQTLGVRVPMQPAKGYHLNIPAPRPGLGIAAVLAEKAVAVTPLGGQLRLAGTVELSGLNHDLVQRRIDMLTIGAAQYIRGIEGAKPLSSWCGLRPCTADGMPVIGWAPQMEGLFIATGHAKMGFALGPVTGRLACECILEGTPSIDLAPMNPDRFGPRSSRQQSTGRPNYLARPDSRAVPAAPIRNPAVRS